MAQWHRSTTADIALRVFGLCLGMIAYAALAQLYSRAHSHAADVHDLTSFALATIGVLSASAGAATMLQGRHLFDEIEISTRWRHG